MSINIHYTFSLAEQRRYEFAVSLDEKSIELKVPDEQETPDWTRLSFKQCPHCPLDTEAVSHCPAAVNLVPLVRSFDGVCSHDVLQVEVITAERRITAKIPAQRAIGSLMGIIFPCSGCPHTVFFRPMARFHLPFASEDETVFRAVSSYLVTQYFKFSREERPDYSLEGLSQVYKNIGIVNNGMAERLRAATSTDSSINAVIFLDMYAKAMPYVIKSALNELQYLFDPFLQSDLIKPEAAPDVKPMRWTEDRCALYLENEKRGELIKKIEKAKQEWESTMDCLHDMVILTDTALRIQRCNKAVCAFTKQSYSDLIGKKWLAVIDDESLDKKGLLGSSLEYFHEQSGRWLYLNIYPRKNLTGDLAGFVITLHDFTDIKNVSRDLQKSNQELAHSRNQLQNTIEKLKNTQVQLLQQEKMASIGQLAAGVAHEINNPMGFINSNLNTLGKYTERLKEYFAAQEALLAECNDENLSHQLFEARKKLKLDFILEDIEDITNESLDGCDRVKKIVADLKCFARADPQDLAEADLHKCLDSTLNIVWNEIKYKARVKKDYGKLPPLLCYPQKLNQVFMNLLINAAQAIDKEGEIGIRTWQEERAVCVAISDNGSGIAKENMSKIFDPFFTTKEIGKGTGIGLSVVYDIVTKNHGGSIEVQSEIDQGSCFTVRLPMREAA